MASATSAESAPSKPSLVDSFQQELTQNSESQPSSCAVCSCLAKNVGCSEIGNRVYDVVTACISIADIVTDVVVMTDFYLSKRFTFFYISLAILIIAQLSYAVAFVIKFVDPTKWHWIAIVQWFLCALIVSPFMSFIFYWTSDENMFLAKFFKNKLELSIEKNETEYHESWVTETDKQQTQKSQIAEWIKIKMKKHLGFIMEAAIEAFPQSIIQMIAIVYFQETRWINIISILISLTSVASKSLVFSFAITFKVFIFNWLSLVLDFFGIFCILSWVFYNPQHPGQISSLGQVWLYETLIIWAAICLVTGVCMFWSKNWSDWNNREDKIKNLSNCKQFMYLICIAIGNLFLWIAGSALALLITTIALFAPLALLMAGLNDKFSGSDQDNSLAIKLFDFIFEENRLHGIHLYDPNISWQQDRIMRLCCISRELDKTELFQDINLIKFLKTQEKSSFRNVTLKQLRHESTQRGSKANHLVDRLVCLYLEPTKGDFKALKTSYDNLQKNIIAKERNHTIPYKSVSRFSVFVDVVDLLFTLCVFWLLFPIWCVSRVFYFVFPIVSMLSVVFDNNSNNINNNLNPLQIIMTCCYWVVFVVWSFNLVRVSYFYYWTHHIAVGASYVRIWKSNANKAMKNIKKDFDEMAQKIIVNKIINDCLGKDTGSVVFEYWSSIELSEEDSTVAEERKDDR